MTNLALFSLNIFQQEMASFMKHNFFGQTLLSCHSGNQSFTYHIHISSFFDIRIKKSSFELMFCLAFELCVFFSLSV